MRVVTCVYVYTRNDRSCGHTGPSPRASARGHRVPGWMSGVRRRSGSVQVSPARSHRARHSAAHAALVRRLRQRRRRGAGDALPEQHRRRTL